MTVLTAARKRLVALRDRRDELLHPRRHASVSQALQAIQPQWVLFVCLGNVCRSPYAEFALRQKSPGLERVESAGFISPGRAPPDTALRVASRRGVDHAKHRSKVITSALADAHAVFIFDRFNARRLKAFREISASRIFWLGDLDPLWAGQRAIIDPWGKAEDEFEAVFERIDRCVERLAEIIGSPARP